MKRSRSQIGVTNLEIAGVLVIIAIVVAILLPAFQNVPSNDPRTSCASNMKQLGLAFMQYTNDSDAKMPPGVDSLNHGWAGQLYPYVKSTGCYQCPEDDHNDPHFISYAENQRLAGQSTFMISNPLSTVELYEFTTHDCDPTLNESNSATGLIAPQNDRRHDWYSFALNFLVGDGHVKYLRPAAISSGPNPVKPKPVMGDGYVLTFAAY